MVAGRVVSLALGMALAIMVQPMRGQGVAAPRLPAGVAYDAAGNLYFADVNRHQVYEATLAGALVVVAGSGVQGFAGDGGAAVSAELDSPQGVAVGLDGTIYIADTGNQRIRAVAAGQISTFAGSGVKGFAGDGGPAANAAFREPVALAVDLTGALLICDSGNQRLRRVSGGVVSTIAGSGVQGFSGDGAPATAAAFDTPGGVAVGADGRVYVADSHNQRLRVIALDGTVSTFAGTGVAGYSGDGGAATAAKLSLPRGVVAANGAVIFADANNQRIRRVDATGTISTIAGDGVQGTVTANSPAGAAASNAVLNSPRGVGVSSFASPVFSDSANRMVRVLLSNANLYLPNGMTTGRTSTVMLAAASNAVYGQASATVSVSGSAGTPQGAVQLLDGGAPVGSATLSGGAATIGLAAIRVGTHTLSAVYAGDGVNPSAVSGPTSVAIAPATIIATANALTVAYGLAIPVVTGTISGVQTQDAGNVNASFSTTAVYLSPVGTYPITATLSGSASGNYSLAMSPASGAVTIAQAATAVVEQVPNQGYAGMPMVLTATVAPATSGTPTGTVNFLNSGTVVASAKLVSGNATGTWLSPTAGAQSLVAAYGGDGNFTGSSSAVATAVVAAMPDFALTVPGGAEQTVQGGLIATYSILVAAAPGPFTGAVSMSASGAPAGAVVSFSPAQAVPGAGAVTVTMSVLTPVKKVGVDRPILWLGLVGAIVLGMKRRRRLVGLVCLLGLLGCGARTLPEASAGSQSYAITVTGTSTNLAGAVVVHSAGVTLVVD